MATDTGLTPPPPHVSPERIVPFDIYDLPGSDEDVQLAYRAFQQAAPSIFWTPHNGGHWVATRAEHIEAIQKDTATFSHQRITLPRMPDSVPKQIPLELDPPEHAPYRRPLMQALLPRVVNAMEPAVRARAIELIEPLVARGACEFVDDFAGIFPVSVFLELVNIPQDDRETLRELAERSVRASDNDVRMSSFHDLGAYLAPVVIARRERPGTDLLSAIVTVEIEGKMIPFDKAMSFAMLVMFGGLDTVASMLAFIARFLAIHDDVRRQIAARLDDAAFLRHAIEELLRRHGLANTARVLTRDVELDGVMLKAGEMILPPNMLVGLDERKVSDPTTVDLSRPFPIRHAVFGNGHHTCPGAVLARREIQIFLEEWLGRIPEFRIRPGSRPIAATGMVNGIVKLELEWDGAG